MNLRIDVSEGVLQEMVIVSAVALSNSIGEGYFIVRL